MAHTVWTLVTVGEKTRTFDVAHDDHDEEAVVVGVVGVVNAGGDLARADDFLQRDQHELDGQESHAFVEEVHWAVEEEVPVFGLDTAEGKIRCQSLESKSPHE